jgi:archaetidylinositol phosphate synthase
LGKPEQGRRNVTLTTPSNSWTVTARSAPNARTIEIERVAAGSKHGPSLVGAGRLVRRSAGTGSRGRAGAELPARPAGEAPAAGACPALPRWLLPDDLTALGVVAALGVCAAYLLSNESSAWLWAASALLAMQWFGDSLDGTLARVRAIQRPRYGYYLDHLVDAVATAAIGIGLGLSPYMLLSVGTLLVVAYLVLSINVYLESQALGRFSIGYGRLGPTEARLLLIALNSALALGLLPSFSALGTGLTALDVAGVAGAAAMAALLVHRARRNLRTLAAAEPAARRGRLQ